MWLESSNYVNNTPTQSIQCFRPHPECGSCSGKHRINLLQHAHVVDVYDFDWKEAPENLADGGNNVGYTRMARGAAKPFLSWGSASKIPWEGQR